MKKFLTFAVVGVILLYSIFSFIELSIDPRGWNIISRIALSILTLSWLYVVERFGSTWD